MTLLLSVVQNNFTHSALCLLKEERHLPVNAVDQKGNTPLHYAVKLKNLTLIKALLSAGKSPPNFSPKHPALGRGLCFGSGHAAFLRGMRLLIYTSKAQLAGQYLTRNISSSFIQSP